MTGYGRTDVLALDRYIVDPSPTIAVGLFWSVAFPKATQWVTVPVLHRENISTHAPSSGTSPNHPFTDFYTPLYKHGFGLPEVVEEDYI